MAKRNRRRREGRSMASLTGRWVAIAAVAVCLSLLYVWQHVQLVRAGYAIRAMERELEQRRKANEVAAISNERLKNPNRIERALGERNLGLASPPGRNIVRLRNPTPAGTEREEESGSSGGTDTLLSYAGRRIGAGRNQL
ncbi:MAG: hypothetical protein PHN82_10455 [bacterium]|nr:hypothetical protein [bacterium]